MTKQLSIGQKIGLQDPRTLRWSSRQIMEKCAEPMAYIVQTSSGSLLRRNRRFLKEFTPCITTTSNAHLWQGENTDNSTVLSSTSRMMQNNPCEVNPTLRPNEEVGEHETIHTPRRPVRSTRKPERLIETI